jgi:hypothetical protein
MQNVTYITLIFTAPLGHDALRPARQLEAAREYEQVNNRGARYMNGELAFVSHDR